jgi:hypothetical protein
MRKRLFRSAAIALVTAGILTTAGPAFATPSPPTNGGNGAGQSGQCTGNPTDGPIPARASSELPGLRFEDPGASGSGPLPAWLPQASSDCLHVSLPHWASAPH